MSGIREPIRQESTALPRRKRKRRHWRWVLGAAALTLVAMLTAGWFLVFSDSSTLIHVRGAAKPGEPRFRLTVRLERPGMPTIEEQGEVSESQAAYIGPRSRRAPLVEWLQEYLPSPARGVYSPCCNLLFPAGGQRSVWKLRVKTNGPETQFNFDALGAISVNTAAMHSGGEGLFEHNLGYLDGAPGLPEPGVLHLLFEKLPGRP